MLAQPSEMGDGARERRIGPYIVENGPQSLGLERARSRSLVPQEPDLRDETDVRKAEPGAHQEFARRHQRAADPREIRRERFAGLRMVLADGCSTEERQQIRLRVPRKHESSV